MTDRFFILTGGPGGGKTSLANALAAHHVTVMPEAGRAIICREQRDSGHALPWKDRLAFADAMLAWDIERFRDAGAYAAPVIFERAIPDILGFLRAEDLAALDTLSSAASLHRYNPTVLVAPYWDEIFC